VKRRQVFRLLAGLKHQGAASLVSKRRGRPSNNRLPEAYGDLALSLVREGYADFGPTLAAGKLAEVHGCTIPRETLRGRMIAAGLCIDLHHPLTEADDLDEILAWREERTVTHNLTLRYDRMMLLLNPTPFARGLAGKKVEVVNYPDGRFAVRHGGVALSFRVFDKIQTVAPGAIVENKRLGAALAFVRELQTTHPPNRRRNDPRRQRPPNNLEALGIPTKGRPSRKVLAAVAAE
jgi:hypothetical protein